MSPGLEGFVYLFASVAIFALIVVLPWAVVWLITGPVETAWDRYEQYNSQAAKRSESSKQSNRKPARQSRRTENRAPSARSRRPEIALPDEREGGDRDPREREPSVRIPGPTQGERK